MVVAPTWSGDAWMDVQSYRGRCHHIEGVHKNAVAPAGVRVAAPGRTPAAAPAAASATALSP